MSAKPVKESLAELAGIANCTCGTAFNRGGTCALKLNPIILQWIITGISMNLARGLMNEREELNSTVNLTPAQEALRDLWEEHIRCEFAAPNTESTLATMVLDAYVNHIPVLTGGVGREELREFYSTRFIP
jgi:hypothetical protein